MPTWREKTCLGEPRLLPTNEKSQATALWLCQCRALQIRTFHVTWFTFWCCFVAWFSTANLWTYMKEDLGLSDVDRAIAGGCSVGSAVIGRLITGAACQKYGCRVVYTVLPLLGVLSLVGMASVQERFGFIIASFCLGFIGSSFVITSIHTTLMFSGKTVGAANALAAGWGNFGAGCSNAILPLVVLLLNSWGVEDAQAWRGALAVPAVLLLICCPLYWFATRDTPNGNFAHCCGGNAKHHIPASHQSNHNTVPWTRALTDYRVWALVVAYAGCFGVELTVVRFTVGFYQDDFGTSVETAGFIVLSFSFMTLIARPFGGVMGDIVSHFTKFGIQGRTYTLFAFMMMEAITIGLYSLSKTIDSLVYSVIFLVVFSVFVQACEGLTFAVTPFVQPELTGLVAGLVGAGGNVGAVLFAFGLYTFVPGKISYTTSWYVITGFVLVASLLVLTIRFSEEEKATAQRLAQTVPLDGANKTGEGQEQPPIGKDNEGYVSNQDVAVVLTGYNVQTGPYHSYNF